MAKKEKTAQKPKNVSLVLQANNTEYQSSGDSIYEAISALPVPWIELKTKGNLIVSKGEKSAEKFMFLALLKRLLRSPLYRKLIADQLEYLLR